MLNAYKQMASILVIGLVRKILRESPIRTVPIQGFSNWIAIRSRSRKSGSRTGSGIEDRGPAHHWAGQMLIDFTGRFLSHFSWLGKKPAVSLLKITIIHAGLRLGLKEVDHEIMTLTVAEPATPYSLSTISQRGRLELAHHHHACKYGAF